MSKNVMNENWRDLRDIEKEVSALMHERSEILRLEQALSREEIDRLFEIHAEIGWCFERQSMLLPLVEDGATASRWDSIVKLSVAGESKQTE